MPRLATALLWSTLSALLLVACKPTGQPPAGQDASDDVTLNTFSDLPAGVTLVEDYAGTDASVSVPYSKYRLDNGLTVILHQDHSDPMAHVDVAYHVGSSREEPGRSGFAHFFEHMMFEGSAHVPEGAHSKIITDAGGTLNGTTNSDRTNYYQTIPVNQLELALWLEADRMGFLLEAVDQAKFEVQRETVKNERGQRVDNVPYGRVSETMMQNLYPPEHPYSWPVVGWTPDLDAATLADLERFFLQWYGPNNAQLVIGGDIDIAQTLQWVVKYFGPVPPGPAIQPLIKQPGKLERDRYVTLQDNIHLPALAILFPTVYYYHDDEAPLDAAAKILGQGKASLLYQRLVQSGRAVSAYVSHACRELACEMAFVVVQNPSSGETLAEMEAAIEQTMAEFVERGVSQDDLDKFKAEFESAWVFGMQSISGKVSALAYSEMFNADPKAVEDDLGRYSRLTPEDVTRAFRQYVQDKPAVILSIVPTGQTQLAANDPNYATPQPIASGTALNRQPDVSPARPPDTPSDAPQLRLVEDDFDRSLRPQPGSNPVVLLPPVMDSHLANGVRLLAVSNDETPTVTIQVSFDMGQRDEPAGKAGLANLTAALMNESTVQRSAAEFTEALERIGAAVSVSSGQYTTTVTLDTLAKYLAPASELMLERLLQPAFSEEDFTKAKGQVMESLMQARKSGPALASRAIAAALAGPVHPLSYPESGLPSTVETITLDEVKAFYTTHIPAHMQGVLVSTSLPLDEVKQALSGLAALRTTPLLRARMGELPARSGRRIYLVDKAGAAQSSVRIAHRSLPYDALGDYYLAGLMNFTLGGTFDSRINLELREEKGWTYGAYTNFSGGPEVGSFNFSGEINQEATGQAIQATLAQLEKYSRDGMTAEEYLYLQNAVGQRDALQYETPGNKLGLLSQILTYDLPLDYRQQQQVRLKQTDRERLNTLAGQLIDADNLAIVVVGDLQAIQPQLEALDLPMRQLDEEGFERTPE